MHNLPETAGTVLIRHSPPGTIAFFGEQIMSEAAGSIGGEYTIDPAHSRLGFVARHAMVTKVRGQFSDVVGNIHIDPDTPQNSSGTARIKTGSIDTQQQQRDDHLRSSDFFDAERFPEIVFRSTSIEQKSSEEFTVHGELTIRDVTQPITFDLLVAGQAKDPMGNTRLGLEGSTQVNRKDWGLTWNAAMETGGWLVSEKVAIELDVSAIKNG